MTRELLGAGCVRFRYPQIARSGARGIPPSASRFASAPPRPRRTGGCLPAGAEEGSGRATGVTRATAAGRRHHAQAQPRGAPRHHLAERGPAPQQVWACGSLNAKALSLVCARSQSEKFVPFGKATLSTPWRRGGPRGATRFPRCGPTPRRRAWAPISSLRRRCAWKGSGMP